VIITAPTFAASVGLESSVGKTYSAVVFTSSSTFFTRVMTVEASETGGLKEEEAWLASAI
jgi:hypothetical protein